MINRILEDTSLPFELLRRLLYGRELREAMAEIKAKNDFRAEGLKRSTLAFILVQPVCLAAIALPIAYLSRHWDSVSISGILLWGWFSGSFAFAQIVGWRHFRRISFLTVSKGTIGHGVIHFAEFWLPRGGNRGKRPGMGVSPEGHSSALK